MYYAKSYIAIDVPQNSLTLKSYSVILLVSPSIYRGPFSCCFIADLTSCIISIIFKAILLFTRSGTTSLLALPKGKMTVKCKHFEMIQNIRTATTT